eukprot:3219855-Amphidinium_carterae.1
MDPTHAEAEQFIAIDLAAEWVDLPPDARESLYAYLGVQAADPSRLLAALPHADNYLDLWLMNGRAPSPVLRAKSGLLVRACRVHCGLDPSELKVRAFPT